MKKIIFIILSCVALSSCATIFAGGTGCRQKPDATHPKRKIRPVPFIFDIAYTYGIGLIVDFATGDIYKPCSEMSPQIDPTFEWSETIEVQGVSKAVLYQRAIEWYNTTFNDMKDVIQDKDKDIGTFYGKGIILSRDFMSEINHQYFGSSDAVTFSVNIAVKDGKYKYTLTNFVHSGTRTQYNKTYPRNGGYLKSIQPDMRISKKQWRAIKQMTSNKVNSFFIPSLKEKMQVSSMPETF